MNVMTEVVVRDGQAFLEKRLGDRVIRRQITEEELRMRNTDEKKAELDQWHEWAEGQLLTENGTEL